MPSNEYWAGFFDGEGAVSITNGLRVSVALAQKNSFVLELAKRQFGGEVYRKDKKKWRAYVFIKGKQIFLGYFDLKRDAKKARIDGEKK